MASSPSQIADERNPVPLGPWTYHSPRAELALGHEQDVKDPMRARLHLWGNGDVHGIGWWRSEAVLRENCWYRARVGVQLSDLAHPALSVFAHAAGRFMLPTEGWGPSVILEQTFRHDHPEYGSAFELFLKASATGKVTWFEPTITPTDPPAPRTVRIVTARFGPPSSPLTLDQQRSRVARRLNEAGAVRPDIVVLPEFCQTLGVPRDQYKSYDAIAEVIPQGPMISVLAEAAKRHHMYVLAGMIERRGQHVFNTAVIVDRNGDVVGRYDKTHLTVGELVGGISCGNDYPLFDLDFGRIAVHTCVDEWFPEVARYYAHRGAEVLFLPLLGGKPITWRTRALDNRVYFVTAADLPPSMIIDSSGAIIAQNQGDGFAAADIDLSWRKVNWHGDPYLSEGMPTIFPEMRHVLDDQLLRRLHDAMRSDTGGLPLPSDPTTS